MHSTADGPGASETRDNGSRNPALGVNLRDLAHSRGSASFAPQTPPVCRSTRRGCFKTIGQTLPGPSLSGLSQIRRLSSTITQPSPQRATVGPRILLAAPCPQVMSLPSDNLRQLKLIPATTKIVDYDPSSSELAAFCRKRLVAYDLPELCEEIAALLQRMSERAPPKLLAGGRLEPVQRSYIARLETACATHLTTLALPRTKNFLF